MEFLPLAGLLVASLLALFVTGTFAQPRAARGLTPRALWSTVVAGNDVLAPTTPYQQFARS